MTTKRTDTRPRLYTRLDSKWWWFSWSTVDDDGEPVRYRLSCQRLNLCPATHTRDQALDAILRYYGMSDIPEPGTETLGWLKGHLYHRLRRDGLRDSTINETRIGVDHLITLYGETCPLASITRKSVDDVKMYLLDKGDRPSTVNKVLRHIRALWNTLIDDGVLDANPFVRFKPLAKPTGEIAHMQEEQVYRFMTCVRESPENIAMRRLAFVYLATGMRRREVLRLTRDDIDLANNRLRVTNIKHKKLVQRWITLPRGIRGDIEWFLNRSDSDQPLNICHPDTITHYVKRWIRRAELPDTLKLHSLRHTFATLALKHESVWRVRDHLGHSDIRTTQGYTHTDVDDGRELDLGIDFDEHNGGENGKT